MFEDLDLSGLRQYVDSQSQRQKVSSERIKELVASAVMRRCLAGRPFRTKDIWNDVPELQHQAANVLGTVLGKGLNGKGGFGLSKGRDGFAPCFENVLFVQHELVTNGQWPSFLESESLTEDLDTCSSEDSN